ncbi:MAG: hypothetical protein ACRCTD_16920 [Beijerinckiaceae bacterium]
MNMSAIDHLVKLCISRHMYFFPLEEIGHPDLLREKLCFSERALVLLADSLSETFYEAGYALFDDVLASRIMTARTVGDVTRLVQMMIVAPLDVPASGHAARAWRADVANLAVHYSLH